MYNGHKKIYLLIFIGLFLLLSQIGCKKSTPEVKNPENTVYYAIYVVQGMSPLDAVKLDINKLPLETSPILTDRQIVNYNWRSHEFELYNDILTQRLHGKVPLTGKPFVVIAEGQRIYVGAFWTPISSVNPPGIPLIISTWTPGTEKKIYDIEELGSRTDMMHDERILKALKKAGKLTKM